MKSINLRGLLVDCDAGHANSIRVRLLNRFPSYQELNPKRIEILDIDLVRQDKDGLI